MAKFINIPGNVYNKYTSKNLIVKLLMERFYGDFSSLLKRTDAKNVIEVGCGEGYITKYLKDNNNIDIIGIDLEESIIEKAKELHPDMRFFIGDIYQTNFPDNSFDCVIASEVLEHLEEPIRAIDEMKRISKGHCLFSVPNEPFFRMANIARLKYLNRLGNTPGHIQNWTKHQFKTLLKRHFSKVIIKTSNVWTIALCKK
ncbi:MAG: class I SAM-dependent methyltransferase [Candidatus Woesearchaeota archaeon]